MERFQFQTEDAQGHRGSGVLEARSADEARRSLEQQGWRVLEVVPVPMSEGRPQANLSDSAGDLILAQLAELERADLPLGEGFRAAAAESDNRSLSVALTYIAEQLDAGRDLDSVLATTAGLPPHVRGLVAIAGRTASLGNTLYDLLEQRRRHKELRRNVLSALIYPAVVLVLSVCLFVVLVMGLVGPFKVMFTEFELNLPPSTALLFWWHDTGIWWLLTAIGGFAAGLALAYACLPRSWWESLIVNFPLFGPLWGWSALSEWTQMLGILLEHRVPVSDSLEWVSSVAPQGRLGLASLEIRRRVLEGHSLSDSLWADQRFPTTLIPLVLWGEQSGSLDNALRTASDFYAERARTRAELLRTVVPPWTFVLVGISAVAIIPQLFIPLVSLLFGLA